MADTRETAASQHPTPGALNLEKVAQSQLATPLPPWVLLCSFTMVDTTGVGTSGGAPILMVVVQNQSYALQGFQTGPSPAGYTINSVTLQLHAPSVLNGGINTCATDSGCTFDLRLYTASDTWAPQTQVGGAHIVPYAQLTPAPAGSPYTYTLTSPWVLAASTRYTLAVGASLNPAPAFFVWVQADSIPLLGWGWSVGGHATVMPWCEWASWQGLLMQPPQPA